MSTEQTTAPAYRFAEHFGDSAAMVESVARYMHETNEGPDVPFDAASLAATTDVYSNMPELYAEDRAAYLAAGQPKPADLNPDPTTPEPTTTEAQPTEAQPTEAETPATFEPIAIPENVTPAPPIDSATYNIPETAPTKDAAPEAIAAYNETVKKSIAAEIIANIQSEGDRNIAIGRRALNHCRWTKNVAPKWEAQDYEQAMRDHRDRVRMFIPIKPGSIRVNDWTLAAEAQDRIRDIAGPAVDFLSFHELRTLSTQAMSFSRVDLTGVLTAAYIPTIRSILADRATGKTVSSEDFTARLDKTSKAITEANKPAPTPADAQKQQQEETAKKIQAKIEARNQANTNVTTALSDAIGQGHITPEQAFAIAETVIKEHGQTAPAYLGLDPTRCTMPELKTFVDTLAAKGRMPELKYLSTYAGRMVASAEQRLASMGGRAATVPMTQAKATA